MARKILVADLLCGAGGSSTGCARALADLGLTMEIVCVNHWGVGNAVSVRKMKACVAAIMADAAPKKSARETPRLEANGVIRCALLKPAPLKNARLATAAGTDEPEGWEWPKNVYVDAGEMVAAYEDEWNRRRNPKRRARALTTAQNQGGGHG